MGIFDSVARRGGVAAGSGLLVLALCADKREARGATEFRLVGSGFRQHWSYGFWRPWRPKSGPSRDSLAMPFGSGHRALAGLLDEPDSSPAGDPMGALQLLPSLYYTL